MPTATVQPTANTTPNLGGTTAVTSASNTGHGSTSIAASASLGTPSASQEKTCRWDSFTDIGGSITAISLQFTWSTSGSVSASTDNLSSDDASAAASFTVEYSLNGGSSWTTAASKTASAASTGGGTDTQSMNGGNSESISIAATTDITQIQVRDDLFGIATVTAIDATPTASVSFSGTVSGIQLTVTTQGGNMIIML